MLYKVTVSYSHVESQLTFYVLADDVADLDRKIKKDLAESRERAESELKRFDSTFRKMDSLGQVTFPRALLREMLKLPPTYKIHELVSYPERVVV